MRHKDLFKTYIWLVETIHRLGSASLQELGRLWENSSLYDGNPLARTSFNRHREDIEDIFGIRIICNRSDGWRYSIENTGELDKNTVQNWMANTISLNNVIAENPAVHDRILLENIPSEGANLQKAIEAMTLSRLIEVDYRKYNSDTVKHYSIEPYCVKLYHRRWYLLARYPDKGELRILSFDRILGLSLSDKKFKIDPSFNAAEAFRDCYGIVRDPAVPVQKIIIRAYGTERFYMRDLPLHPSQRMTAKGDNFADYEVTLHPTDDFKGHLLSRGAWIKVLSPASFVEEFATLIKNMADNYQ